MGKQILVDTSGLFVTQSGPMKTRTEFVRARIPRELRMKLRAEARKRFECESVLIREALFKFLVPLSRAPQALAPRKDAPQAPALAAGGLGRPDSNEEVNA
jgi:hypothetical protein